jgi:hypothetical protein
MSSTVADKQADERTTDRATTTTTRLTATRAGDETTTSRASKEETSDKTITHGPTGREASETPRVVTAVTVVAAPTTSTSPVSAPASSGFALVRASSGPSVASAHSTHYLLGHPLPGPGVSLPVQTLADDSASSDAHDRALGVAATAGLSLLGLALFFIALFVIPAMWRRRPRISPRKMEDQVAGQRVSRWLAAETAGGHGGSGGGKKHKSSTSSFSATQEYYPYEDADEKDAYAIRTPPMRQLHDSVYDGTTPWSPPAPPLPVLTYHYRRSPSPPPLAATSYVVGSPPEPTHHPQTSLEDKRATGLAYVRPLSLAAFPFPGRVRR